MTEWVYNRSRKWLQPRVLARGLLVAVLLGRFGKYLEQFHGEISPGKKRLNFHLLGFFRRLGRSRLQGCCSDDQQDEEEGGQNGGQAIVAFHGVSPWVKVNGVIESAVRRQGLLIARFQTFRPGAV